MLQPYPNKKSKSNLRVQNARNVRTHSNENRENKGKYKS